MEKDIKELEEKLKDMTTQKETADRRLLKLEIVIVLLSSIILFTLVFVASFVEMPSWIRILLIIIGIIPLFPAMFIALRIEQIAGYYECGKCHHRYVPTYKQASLAMKMGRTRYMKCPKCGEKSWSKKVLSKEK